MSAFCRTGICLLLMLAVLDMIKMLLPFNILHTAGFLNAIRAPEAKHTIAAMHVYRREHILFMWKLL